MTALNAELINADILPAMHRELAELIGLHATLELGELYNGVRMYVPTALKDDHPALNVLGPYLFEQLIDEYGGEEIAFPKLDAAVRQIKVKLIADLLSKRCTTKEIALQTGLTQRRVQQIKAELGIVGNDDQMGLF